MQYFYENRYFENQASVALNPLVSLFGSLVARSGRISGTVQTDGRMDRPSTVTLAAHARRGLIKVLTDFYGHAQEVNFQGECGHFSPDVDPDQTEAKWKIFGRIMLVKFKNDAVICTAATTQHVISSLVTSDALTSGSWEVGHNSNNSSQ